MTKTTLSVIDWPAAQPGRATLVVASAALLIASAAAAAPARQDSAQSVAMSASCGVLGVSGWARSLGTRIGTPLAGSDLALLLTTGTAALAAVRRRPDPPAVARTP